MPNPWPRRLVALFLHAPGLWLIYREPLPRHLRRPNLIAALATLAGMAATSWLGSRPLNSVGRVLLVWMVGHLSWGLYLAVHLPAGSGNSSE